MLQLLKRTDAVTPRGSNHDIGYRGVTASVLFSSCRIVNLPRIFLSRAVPLKVHAFYASRKSCARFVKISGDLEQSRAILPRWALAPMGPRSPRCVLVPGGHSVPLAPVPGLVVGLEGLTAIR